MFFFSSPVVWSIVDALDIQYVAVHCESERIIQKYPLNIFNRLNVNCADNSSEFHLTDFI